MTARAETPVLVDAAVVYAEGVLAGLRTACNVIGRNDAGDIPPELHRLVRTQRAIVYHNQWLAERGRPADFPDLPSRDELLARIHVFMGMFPEFRHVD